MSVTLAAVLIIGGLLGAASLVIGIPLLIGMMFYDVSQTQSETRYEKADASLRIAVERGVARSFVLLGGAFWSTATFAGMYSFRETGTASALLGAFFPLAAVAVTLVVGWYYERLTAVLLAVASFAVIAWGVIYQFEAGVWMLMTIALIGPMLTASVLFWLARREQEAFERLTQARPELALVFAARSSL